MAECWRERFVLLLSIKIIFMKKMRLFGVLILVQTAFYSCSNTNEKTGNVGDSTVKNATLPGENFYLEDLLTIKSEAELKQKFGAAHVKFDTIWGAEGNFGFGTYLDKGTKDEVQLIWKDSTRTSGVSTAIAVSFFEKDGNSNFDNKWSSSKGVKLGMTTDNLEKLNGKAFLFSGFGWDYGGQVIDWQKGKLDETPMGIELTEGLNGNNLSESDGNEILGDRDVRSDNKVVKKMQPRVYRISVYVAME